MSVGTPSYRLAGIVALEAIGAIAAATLLVAALEGVASVGDLRAIYLLAVLFFVAVRRSGAAAVVTAVGSVLALNFFFVDPRHQLRISHSRDLVALLVFLVAALVVGRLASESRARADEAESRLRLAEVREREAALVARVASAVMGGARIDEELPRIASDGEIRVSISPVPSHSKDEHAVRLQSGGGSGWLYVRAASAGSARALERLAEPLAQADRRRARARAGRATQRPRPRRPAAPTSPRPPCCTRSRTTCAPR